MGNLNKSFRHCGTNRNVKGKTIVKYFVEEKMPISKLGLCFVGLDDGGIESLIREHILKQGKDIIKARLTSAPHKLI